jgi:hypothetical protein
MRVGRAGKVSNWTSACWSGSARVALCGAATLLVAGSSTPVGNVAPEAPPSAEQVTVGGGISVCDRQYSVVLAWVSDNTDAPKPDIMDTIVSSATLQAAAPK